MMIDTSDIEKPIFVIVVLILAAAIAYTGYSYNHAQSQTPVVINNPTVVTPIPTPTPDPSYLTNVVTVSSATTSGGFPQVNIRQDNRIFDVTYSDYDRLSIGDRVQFHVVSTYNPYGTVVYKTDYVNIISHSWSNTKYYYYNHKYWRDDDRVTIEVDRDEAWEHEYENKRPRHWRD